MEYEITRVAEDDPWRCQATKAKGQCLNKATTLGGTCAVHGGNKRVEDEERKNIRNYQLNKFQQQLNRHADSPRLKSLNDEVAILRMMLEEQLNQCNDVHDLVLKSHLISDLVLRIEKLVKSCHSLERNLGSLMDKQALLTFASGVIGAIGDHIEDEHILEALSQDILSLVPGSDEAGSN
ncbi:MAG: hypothetical protein D4S01_03115 [Dehalococcoidia bacterium]|nr:MAG: hypothetical protein D4S01_03115 [Dehalococcoidia bacterium]